MSSYNIEEDPRTENVSVIEDDTTDELMKTIKDMKDGQAMTIVIGDTDTTKQIYLVYREPIEKQVEAYTATDGENRDSVLNTMKHEDFDKLLEEYAEKLSIQPSSACSGYKPSMFEAKK